ncbi:hypothetical protein P9112_005575 [Eukaryota sp. TZLM1-RC]
MSTVSPLIYPSLDSAVNGDPDSVQVSSLYSHQPPKSKMPCVVLLTIMLSVLVVPTVIYAITYRSATVTVVGKVIDEESGHPVKAALVSIYNHDYGKNGYSDVSDTTGSFRLANLHSGESVVHVTAMEYHPKRVVVKLPTDDELILTISKEE